VLFAAGVLMIVRHHNLEPGVRLTQRLAGDLAAASTRCGAWHSTQRVVVGRCDPRTFAPMLKSALAERSAMRPASF
jgi:hypothetical protein